jgi:hypothetical protein
MGPVGENEQTFILIQKMNCSFFKFGLHYTFMHFSCIRIFQCNPLFNNHRNIFRDELCD